MKDTMIEASPPHAITPTAAPDPKETVFALLFAISFSHMLNDTIQALLPAIYPVLKETEEGHQVCAAGKRRKSTERAGKSRVPAD